MKPVRRRWLFAVLAVSFSLPWSSAADARGLRARPRGHWRVPRARWRRAAVDSTVKQLLAAAKENFDNDQPAEAEKKYSAVLRMEPRNVEALVGRGRALGAQNKLDEAFVSFQTALGLDPRNSDALRGRGAIYAQKGDFNRAFAYCDEAIRWGPKNSNAYLTRGWAYTWHHELNKAIADFNRAIELDPGNDFAFYGRGSARVQQDRFDQAVSDYTEVIKLKPRDGTAFYARALVWAKKNEFRKAIADVSEAIRLEPKELGHYLARADVYFQMNDLDRAIVDCSTAIQLDQQCAEAFCYRGWYYGKRGDIDKAISDFDESIRLDPKNAKSRGCRAFLYLDRGELDKALADADAAIQVDLEIADPYRVRGSIFEKKHNDFRAKQDYDRYRQLRLAALLRELDLPTASKQPKSAVDALERRIGEQVKSLEYGDDVARGVVTLVHDWNLVALSQQLCAAREEQKHGKLPKDQLANVEQKVAEHVARIINAIIFYDNEKLSSHELTGVAEDKKGCCQGMAMLYVVLGRALGLHVEGLIVDATPELPAPDGSDHAACLVTLSNSNVMMIDPTGGGLGRQSLASKSFRFDALFRPLGNCWELKDRSNPLGLYRIVQRQDTSGLIAMLFAVRAEDQRRKGNFDVAARWCSEAIRRSPNCAYSYASRGFLLAGSGKFDQAIAEFSTAISHDPAYGAAYASRGGCYEKLGKLDQARDDYRKALELNPKIAEMPLRLSAVYCRKNGSDKAIVKFTNAIEVDPKTSRNYVGRAFAWYTKAEEDRQMADYCNRLTSVQPNNNPAAVGPGDNSTTSWSSTAGPWNSGASTNPLFDSISAGARSQSGTGASTFYFGDYRPVNEEEGRRRTKAFEEDIAKAAADYSEAIRLDPKYVEAYQYRGYLYLTARRFNLAIADFTEAIRLDGKNIALRTARGAIYEYLGDRDKAIADVTEIIRLNPKLAENYVVRAKLYSEKHDTNKAAADLAEAERLNPSDDRYR